MSEKYTRLCSIWHCLTVATCEVRLKSGNWISFCDEHIPKRAAYIRKIQVREDEK